MSEEKVEIAANGLPDVIVDSYEALSRRDLDRWVECTTADVELHEVAEVPDAAVYRGHRQVRDWAEGMLQLADQWSWVPEEVLLAEADTFVIRAGIRGRSATGVPLDLTVFHVIRTEGDKVASFRGFLDRSAALEAAPQ
jgi:ketosteroid isomerase-like protein